MARKSRETQHDLVQDLAAVLSPIARMMIRRQFGAGALVRAAKLSYLAAAKEETLPKGARVNVSRLSVVTGMTRKEVASLLEQPKARGTVIRHHLEQRALKVLRGWAGDPLFQTRLGRPADLELRGHGNTFAALVRSYGGDVTTSAVLKELERLHAVTRSRLGKLKMRSHALRSQPGQASLLSEFAALLRDFTDTAGQLVGPDDPPRYFGFRDSMQMTSVQAAHFQRMFARRAASLLQGVEQWRNRQLISASTTSTRRHQAAIRVGMGVYLIQREDESRKQSRRPIAR